MTGYVKAYRGWQEHAVFGRDEFSRRDAWFWLIEHAAYQAVSVGVGSKIVDLKRGQLCYSLRYMAKAWRWEEPRVRRFLTRIENEKMIECVVSAGQTLITVCNYDKYQDAACVGDAPTDAATTQQRRTGDANKKEGKEGKEVKEESIARSGDDPIADEFTAWYAGFPRKVDRGHALKAYRAARKSGASAEELVRGRDAYSRSCAGKDQKYVKHPATWLTGQCWLDETGATILPLVRKSRNPAVGTPEWVEACRKAGISE